MKLGNGIVIVGWAEQNGAKGLELSFAHVADGLNSHAYSVAGVVSRCGLLY